MARTNVLAHNPSYTTQVTNWRALAENVAYNGSEAAAHTALMASPGHRANILNDTYTQVGIGVATGHGRVWVTQVFRTPTVGSATPPAPTPTPPVRLPTGGAAITAAHDWDGDNKPDLLARTTTGNLYLYPGNGTGGFKAPRKVGHGWNVFS